MDVGRIGHRAAVRGSGALVLALMVLVVAVAPVAGASTSTVGPVEEIVEHVQQGIDDNHVPGAAVGIVTAEGAVRLQGFGTAGPGGVPITPDTPFVIGSVTKSFTALAVMRLVEQGVIGLDDPVAAHLPWFRVTPDNQTPLVTVRTLLHQTSGLGPLAGGPSMRWMADRPLQETARTLAGTPLQTEPGSEWVYANGNYVLLGALIEAVSVESYGDHLRMHILDPLGMDRTFTDLTPARAAGMTEGHRLWFGRPVAHTIHPEGLLPAGLVISTAANMTRYLQMILGGGQLDGTRILSEEGIDALLRPAVAAHLGPWAKDPSASYAAGWFVGGTPFGEGTAVFHPGATPDFGSMAALVPQDGTALVLLMNAGPRTAGAAGAVDRIGAGAVSLLMGSPPAVGRSLGEYYGLFDVAVAAVLLVALGLLVTAIRRPVRRPARRGLRWAGVMTVLLVAAALLATPPVLGQSWRQTALWSPDHAMVLLALAVLLLCTGLLHAWRLLRPARTEAATSPPPPAPATEQPLVSSSQL